MAKSNNRGEGVMGENKLNTFQLAHSALYKAKTKAELLNAEELIALLEVTEMAIGEIVPTKAEMELYLLENEKLLTLSPDDTRFHEAIENVKAFKKDYGL